MEITQKETGLLIYFMSTWLIYPIKWFGVIILKFHNFESPGHKQKFTYSLYLQETEKKEYQKKKIIHTLITNLILQHNLTTKLYLT